MRALAPEVLFQVRKTLDEGHGFSRVPMSLRLTQGDENHLDSPIMILRGLEVVFDCAARSDEGFRARVRSRIYELSPAGTAEGCPGFVAAYFQPSPFDKLRAGYGGCLRTSRETANLWVSQKRTSAAEAVKDRRFAARLKPCPSCRAFSAGLNLRRS